MRVAFFGTPAYALPTLDALVEAGHAVVTVVAQPDRPSGRGQRESSPPTVDRARALGLDVRQPRGLRSGPFPDRYRALAPDVAVVVAYGRILPPAVLGTPRWGSLNAHGSLLPRWRGAAPIERAIMAGDGVTGVCVMRMDEGLDTGPVLSRCAVPIQPEETGAELRARLAELSATLVVAALERLPELSPLPQPEEGVTYASPLTRDDGRLDFSRAARQLHDQVRALSPRPGAWCTFRGDLFKVLRTAVAADAGGQPGEVLDLRGRLVIGAGSGALEVLEGQLPGRKAVLARDLVNGARILPGERFC